MGSFITFSEPNHKTKSTISSIGNKFLEMRGNLKMISKWWKLGGQIGRMTKVRQTED